MRLILDAHQAEKPEQPPKPPQPNKWWAAFVFVLFMASVYAQLEYGTSETKLVEGSYVWVPLLVIALTALMLPIKNSLIGGLVAVIVLFIFYNTIWSSL